MNVIIFGLGKVRPFCQLLQFQDKAEVVIHKSSRIKKNEISIRLVVKGNFQKEAIFVEGEKEGGIAC